jgi:peptidoglycan LD-endopeptidase LytH
MALGATLALSAQPFQLPTANHSLLEAGGEERFFVGTAGKSWTSGQFGCVRSDGQQLHEGIDIRSLQHDRRGEPVDPVLATADGVVVYLNQNGGLSNYGRYVVLKHRVDTLEVYSLYAHLREIRAGLRTGQSVKAGDQIGILGRSSNTRQSIAKDRAHLHFELNLLVNERFPSWYHQRFPGQRNDHGVWNGQNLLGLDAGQVFKLQQQQGSQFSFLAWVRQQRELCRVLVRKTDFSWIRRYPALVQRSLNAEKTGIAGYEIVLNFNGVPIALIPRAGAELSGRNRYQLLSVNAEERRKNPARHLVIQRGRQWELTQAGQNLLELLTW